MKKNKRKHLSKSHTKSTKKDSPTVITGSICDIKVIVKSESETDDKKTKKQGFKMPWGWIAIVSLIYMFVFPSIWFIAYFFFCVALFMWYEGTWKGKDGGYMPWWYGGL